MKHRLFSFKPSSRYWICLMTTILSLLQPLSVWGQAGGETTTEKLANLGFENVRWTENDEERIYTIENNVYKANGVGIAKAIEVIQDQGLPTNKRCKVIVTHLEVPELSLTYQPTGNDSIAPVGKGNWETSYEIGDSWKEVKGEKKKNRSRFKVDILIYPQLSYQNLIITQIYQVLFTLNPTIEISLWSGMKLTGQVIVPVYNDGYNSVYQNRTHPGYITLSQRFRLPFNIKGKATLGYFNADRYGMDLSLFRPFKDERFSVEARMSLIGVKYWKGFELHYDPKMFFRWMIGGNFYWPRYNTQFSLRAQQFLLGETGVKFEMIRHFRYASVGFYAMKAEEAKSNGGFRFQVLLPPYKNKRHKHFPRIDTSHNMGIVYNAGNERRYYKEFKAEASDNIMENNSFNPYFIKSELINY